MNVTQVADRLLAELAPVDPEAAQALGVEPDVVMPALAPQDFQRRDDARRAALAALATATVADEQERVLKAVMEERLGSELALDESGFTRALLAPLATPVHQVREVFDNLPHETPADWERVADHLALVPSALQAYARDAARVCGARPRRRRASSHRDGRPVRALGRRWRGTTSTAGSWPQAPDPASLAALAEGASSATVEFARFLRTELLAQAPLTDAVGRDRYLVTSRAFLGDDVDLDETYAFGWDELARLTDEMQAVAA